MSPPTVIVMLKAPVAGEVKTRLAVSVGDTEAVRIYRLLAERQVRSLPSDWPIEIHFTPASAGVEMETWLRPHLTAQSVGFFPQWTGDLGPRITLAIEGAFERQASGVIVIGGDCPGVTDSFLRAASAALTTHDLVFGPATDGGYTLVGMTRPHPELFRLMPWSTPRVLSESLARSRALELSFALLETLEDVDDGPSWERLRSSVE